MSRCIAVYSSGRNAARRAGGCRNFHKILFCHTNFRFSRDSEHINLRLANILRNSPNEFLTQFHFFFSIPIHRNVRSLFLCENAGFRFHINRFSLLCLLSNWRQTGQSQRKSHSMLNEQNKKLQSYENDRKRA